MPHGVLHFRTAVSRFRFRNTNRSSIFLYVLTTVVDGRVAMEKECVSVMSLRPCNTYLLAGLHCSRPMMPRNLADKLLVTTFGYNVELQLPTMRIKKKWSRAF